MDKNPVRGSLSKDSLSPVPGFSFLHMFFWSLVLLNLPRIPLNTPLFLLWHSFFRQIKPLHLKRKMQAQKTPAHILCHHF